MTIAHTLDSRLNESINKRNPTYTVCPCVGNFKLYYPFYLFILNQSMTEGVFSRHIKTARVIPLYKSGEKNNINNYRPISIVSFFSKIFEKNYLQLHVRVYGKKLI